jgi:hypothetical protein
MFRLTSLNLSLMRSSIAESVVLHPHGRASGDDMAGQQDCFDDLQSDRLTTCHDPTDNPTALDQRARADQR